MSDERKNQDPPEQEFWTHFCTVDNGPVYWTSRRIPLNVPCSDCGAMVVRVNPGEETDQ